MSDSGARVAGSICAVSINIQRRRGSIHDLLRDHHFLDAFEAGQIEHGVIRAAFPRSSKEKRNIQTLTAVCVHILGAPIPARAAADNESAVPWITSDKGSSRWQFEVPKCWP
jgi:hypothetical protein